MSDRFVHRGWGAVVLTAALMWTGTGLGAGPQEGSRATRGPAEEGASMYRGYCAPCHGMKGVGDGPVAASLKTRPTDLTRLTAANRGQFPAERVSMVLAFGVAVPAHGSTDMPTWGDIFRVMGDEAQARQRVSALTRHLESLQVK
jgi:mono/diheme cytochrome c family protein